MTKEYNEKNSLILPSISVMALVTMIVIASLPISEQQSLGQQEQTRNTISAAASSNQSTPVTTSVSNNMTAAITTTTTTPQ
jgi:hypothetical protein